MPHQNVAAPAAAAAAKQFPMHLPRFIPLLPLPTTTTTTLLPRMPIPMQTGKTRAEIFGFIVAIILVVVGSLVCRLGSDYLGDSYYPEFYAESVLVSPFKAAARASNSKYQTTSSSNWNMNVSFVVKKKVGRRAYYDIVHASLFYKKELLSGIDIAPFYLYKGEQTSVKATFGSWERHVNHWVATAIDGLMTKGEAAGFNLKVQARVTVESLSSLSRPDREAWIRVTCGDIYVTFVSNDVPPTMQPAAKMCKVHLDYHED